MHAQPGCRRGEDPHRLFRGQESGGWTGCHVDSCERSPVGCALAGISGCSMHEGYTGRRRESTGKGHAVCVHKLLLGRMRFWMGCAGIQIRDA